MSGFRALYCEIVTQLLERDGIKPLDGVKFTDERASVPVRVARGQGWIELDRDKQICSLRGAVVHPGSPFGLEVTEAGYRLERADALAGEARPAVSTAREAADRIVTTAQKAARTR